MSEESKSDSKEATKYWEAAGVSMGFLTSSFSLFSDNTEESVALASDKDLILLDFSMEEADVDLNLNFELKGLALKFSRVWEQETLGDGETENLLTLTA